MPVTRSKTKNSRPASSHPYYTGDRRDDEDVPSSSTGRNSRVDQQNAQAPREIIEISSDSDSDSDSDSGSSSSPVLYRVPVFPSPLSISKLRLRISQLTEEAKHWKKVALDAKAHPPTDRSQFSNEEAAQSETKFKQFISTMDDHVSCDICHTKMWKPSRHVFAFPSKIAQAMTRNVSVLPASYHKVAYPSYDIQAFVPPLHRSPHLPLATRLRLEGDILSRMSKRDHPTYSCPTCRSAILTKPAKNFSVRHVVHTVAGAQGEPYPAGPQGAVDPKGDAWDNFFPF
ncbi:hypothetical protein C8Q79DRAFT_1012117 [Trametes meyenii]|nr:hypothetical protein C8Q79DRAFT_1012117 [Trametes meyenii]